MSFTTLVFPLRKDTTSITVKLAQNFIYLCYNLLIFFFFFGKISGGGGCPLFQEAVAIGNLYTIKEITAFMEMPYCKQKSSTRH